MAEFHECPGGCGREDIPRRLFACASDWRRLPESMRLAIVGAYAMRAADPFGHIRWMNTARLWYRDNPEGQS